ncbi:MAG: GNAT family N-acetyltransferase [Chloroflexia bacterium]|nr:GNAT family N-acetyltransferase [Chloroflexia bacterium]
MTEWVRTFLIGEPGRDQLLRAVEESHRSWMAAHALVAGGRVQREEGVEWAYVPGERPEVSIPFLRFSRPEEQLNPILQHCRALPMLAQVGCWSLREHKRSDDLGPLLAARGFEWGWQPHWMSRDLRDAGLDQPVPANVRVELVRDKASHHHALASARPRHLWHFTALLDGRSVGNSVLWATTGPLGVAGIFDVGVYPDARRQGVAKAVTRAALQHARELGCQHALLNSTEEGEPLYRSLGFSSLVYGQTWWLHRDRIVSEPPTEMQVRFAEAVGLGNVSALRALSTQGDASLLREPLACGLTPPSSRSAPSIRSASSGSWPRGCRPTSSRRGTSAGRTMCARCLPAHPNWQADARVVEGLRRCTRRYGATTSSWRAGCWLPTPIWTCRTASSTARHSAGRGIWSGKTSPG